MSFRWLAVLLFPLVLQAAPMETMAWHFAMMPYCEFLAEKGEHLEEPRDGNPSVTSIFIAKDQKLKDLSEPFRKHYKLGNDSWLVWNESRKLLIAHGSPITLWQIEQLSRFNFQPVQVALSVSWYLGVEPGRPIPSDLKPLHRTTIVGRSQAKTSQAWGSSNATRFLSEKIEVETTIGDDFKFVESNLDLNWQESVNGKTYCWNYNSPTVLENASESQSILAQVDSPAGGSWTLAAECSILLTDGHPVAEGRLREEEGKEVISSEYPTFIATQERIKIQTSKGEMLLQTFPPWDLFHDATGGSANEIDPFSSNRSELPLKQDGVEIVTIPEELKSWFPQNLIDVRKQIKAYGINFPENGLAGFDHSWGRLFVADFDAGVLDQVQQLTRATCILRPHFVTILENLESSNELKGAQNQRALIISRSGNKASLTCSDENDSTLFHFEVEPTLGDDDRIIDLHFHSERKEPTHKHEGSMSLPVGIEVKTSTTTTESGNQLTESLKASVTRLGGPD